MDDDLFVVDQIDEYRSICISTLARSTVHDARAEHMGGDSGYFIYEVDNRPHSGGVTVLAKAASIDAVLRLIEVWRGRNKNSSALEKIPA